MESMLEDVRRFFEARAVALTGDPWRVIGPGKELEELPLPDDFVPLPAGVLEACGYYSVNWVSRDNGGVYVFRTRVSGAPVYGVLVTSDGGVYWLEVYAADGGLLGAARMDSGFILWGDREAVRRRTWDGDLEPELLAARQQRQAAIERKASEWRAWTAGGRAEPGAAPDGGGM